MTAMEQSLENKKIQRRRMMSYFIEAAIGIIEQNGVEGLSLRKVAQAAGYNSATLYHYFKDIEHLSLMACMKYLRNYTLQLAAYPYSSDPLEAFLEIWDIFCENACHYPKEFYTLFFNKHSNELNNTITEYYELFPEELGKQTELISRMLLGQNIYERNRFIMAPIVEAGWLEKEDAELVNEIIIFCFKEILSQKCANPDCMDGDMMKKKTRQIICRLLPVPKKG